MGIALNPFIVLTILTVLIFPISEISLVLYIKSLFLSYAKPVAGLGDSAKHRKGYCGK